MLTSRPASEALTFAMSSISTSPVASTSPSITPPTRRSPSIYSCPISRSRGPSWTELGWFGVGDDSRGGSSAAGGVGRLAAGLLLKVAHSDVAVQRRAVLDLQPLDLGVGLAFSLDWPPFHYSLLCFHERASPSLGISSDIGFSPKAGSQNTSGLDSFVLAILHLLPGNVG